MRLIDAEKLEEIIINKIDDYAEKAGDQTLYSVLYQINEQPTAYDVDEVVKQLEAEAVCGRLPATLAIEIVNRGGIDGE